MKNASIRSKKKLRLFELFFRHMSENMSTRFQAEAAIANKEKKENATQKIEECETRFCQPAKAPASKCCSYPTMPVKVNPVAVTLVQT